MSETSYDYWQDTITAWRDDAAERAARIDAQTKRAVEDNNPTRLTAFIPAITVNSKLTLDDVNEIRVAFKMGVSVNNLCATYRCAAATINGIVRGKSWVSA